MPMSFRLPAPSRSPASAGRVLAATCAALAALGIAGCSGVPTSMPGMNAPRFDPDDFNTNASIYTRHIDAPPARVCEGARRSLLSQGYLVGTASAEVVAGRKYFQPSNDIHYQVEMRVVCASEGPDKQRTAVFASALQDRYVIKKINNSASLGVGALGSVSLPVSASDDTLVKVGSETVTDARFYDRFFQVFDRFIPPREAPQEVGQASPKVPLTPDTANMVREARESGEVKDPAAGAATATPVVPYRAPASSALPAQSPAAAASDPLPQVLPYPVFPMPPASAASAPAPAP
ncbi:DUF2242 domain-containing protein [Acidovorax sp. GBBC 3334]|uniref:DUF2242 domain-containing protein n=1 Tax=Acidovorax sp. GBBC 3334 TaxID=2940496 RepID=UPI002302234B|nr:DUF2242 domain-containing protein [Acidovorax sp. GBBC 3334]MDA8457252.1 DUF2242 domain-containing protein [Acidovorax sp. GBBC 3334]